MTKTAVKERTAEPALFADMKDVTPKKGDDKPDKPEPKSRKVQGGYTVPGGGKKPKLPTTGTGVVPATPRRAPAVPANLDTPQDFLALINRAASMSKGDVAVIRELLAMKDEQLQKIRVQEYNIAFHAARGRMPPIVKDGTAPNYKYPTLENVSTQVDGIARESGFTHRFGTADSNIPGHYRIVCDLSHVNGHSERHHVDLPADGAGPKGTSNKSAVQAVNSTMSIGRRYLKMMVWDLVILGSDKDGNRPKHVANKQTADAGPSTYDVDPEVPKITKAQENQVLDAIADCGVSHTKFKTNYQINEIGELPLSQYGEALRACADYKENQARKKK